MTPKDFMSKTGFAGAGATGEWQTTVTSLNQTAAETAKLARSGVAEAQSAAETARLSRSGFAGQSSAETNRLLRQNAFVNNGATQDEYTLDFLPNILDNFDQYTYHWKLFITSLEDASSGDVLLPSKQIIIAESGVSDLTIDKVEFHGIAVPSAEAGTGTQTLVKFEIVEPSGAGLLDKMFYQAVSLGIGNWLVMPCFLQLEFRGRDPENSNAIPGGQLNGLGGLRWVWPIKLTNSKAKVDHVGTKYEFDAVVYDELAQSNSYFAIQHNTHLQGLTTFGSAMADLEEKLNADQYEKLIDNYSIPDSYKIIVDPILAVIPLIRPTDNTSTSFGGDFVVFKEKTATYNSGTGIDKIVDSLLGNTEVMQKKMQGSATSSSTPKTASELPDQMKKLWRIVTETRPIAYDQLRQDNAVAITVYIVEYDIGMTDVNASQTGQTPETLPAARKRFTEYANKKILNKKYNYMFTGLNDQVITFDLNMNFSFAASLSRFGGIYYESAIKMIGVAQAKDRAEKEQTAADKVRKIIQFVNDAKSGTKVEAQIKEGQEYLAKTDIDPVLKSRYQALLANVRPAQRVKFTQDIVAAEGIGAGGATDTSLVSARKRAQSLAAPVNGLRFISDVDITSAETKAADNLMQALRKGKLRPVPFRESQNENTLAFSTDASSDAGRSRVANVFATALYSTLDASLQNIKLTVKGDPYWLFPRNINVGATRLPYKSAMSSQADAIDEIKFAHRKHKNSVNLFGTDNFIVIRFRTPKIYNETTGVTDPYTEVETFSGVYKVISIISKFEAGQFSQELTCILDPMINLADFLKDIEAANQRPDPVLSVPPNNIPTEAVKVPSRLATNFRGGAGFDAIDPRRTDLAAAISKGPGAASSTINNSLTELKSNVPPKLRN